MRKWLLILFAVVLVGTAAVPPPAGNIFRRRQLPSQYVDQVTNFFSQHRWAKGKEVLDKGLELYPNDANLQYLAGRYWWNGKNYDRARYHLVKACQINYHFMDAKSLLVNVEEITGNYSSAICYVNELLEVNPYWKGLWLRKVDLYKKMGNFEEANTLLKRLSQIYPNDASVNSDYFDVLETTYQQALVSGDLSTAEDALSEIVRITPNDADYQLAYANILIRKGKREQALDNLIAALDANPGNVPMIKKATDILMETGQNMGALALVRTHMAQHRSSQELQVLYQTLLAESARMENEADPYQLFSRVYGQSGSSESLDYLLTQSVRRGYNEDALFYIAEQRKQKGPSPHLVMLEYEVCRRMGRQEQAIQALDEGAAMFPDSYDINLAYSRLKLSEASDNMTAGQYARAIPLLEFVRERCEEDELRQLAIRRLSVCYRETNQPQLAEQTLRERLRFDPEYAVTVEYAELRKKQGHTPEALDALAASFHESQDSLSRRKLASAYVEMAYPYIRDKMQGGSFEGVLEVCNQVLVMEPDDYWALRYAINASRHPLPYVERGIAAYPEDISFPIKKAQLLAQSGHFLPALDVLRPLMDRYPEDDDLNKTFASIADDYAMVKYKERDYDTAAAYLDTALMLRPLDSPIRYNRGLVYERQKQYDSAYVYQRTYQPSLLEQKEFKAHMDALQARTRHQTVDAGFDVYRFADNTHLVGIASLGYTRSTFRSEFQARINYTGRDPEWDEVEQLYTAVGGRGMQFQLGYTRHFGADWSLMGSGAYATAYFPYWSANVQLTRHLPWDWDVDAGLQYRLLQDKENMYALSLGATHSWEQLYAGGKFMTGTVHNRWFFNGSGRLRYYPIDGGRSYVEVQAGAGTAPEIDFINFYYKSSVYNHLNSFVAIAGQWSVLYNLAFQFSGSWNTLYDQRTSVSYRNMFFVHASLLLSF